MAKLSVKQLQSKIQELSFGPLFMAGAVGFIIILVIVSLGGVTFKSLLTHINRAVADNPPPVPATGGVDFKALDVVALKLGIEIPARNIPTAKFLVNNSPPRIFNFSTIRPQISVGEIAPIFLNVVDPDGDALTAEWTSLKGEITTLGPLGPARWVAPNQVGDYVLSVSVTDNKRGHKPVLASIKITVIPSIPRNVTPEELSSYTTRLVGLVKEEGSKEIYIIKNEGTDLYKRLLVSQDVVAYYPDLDLNSIQTVPQGTLTEYLTTSWIRGRDKFRVYQVNPSGTKQWLNMPFDEFLGSGGSDKAIFTVDDAEVNFYPSGPDINITQ